MKNFKFLRNWTKIWPDFAKNSQFSQNALKTGFCISFAENTAIELKFGHNEEKTNGNSYPGNDQLLWGVETATKITFV